MCNKWFNLKWKPLNAVTSRISLFFLFLRKLGKSSFFFFPETTSTTSLMNAKLRITPFNINNLKFAGSFERKVRKTDYELIPSHRIIVALLVSAHRVHRTTCSLLRYCPNTLLRVNAPRGSRDPVIPVTREKCKVQRSSLNKLWPTRDLFYTFYVIKNRFLQKIAI